MSCEFFWTLGLKVARAAGPGRKLRFLLGHASGAWSEAPLPARPCIRGLVGSSASCSAMHPGPGRKLRFLLGHASGAWSEAPLPARPCIRGLVGSFPFWSEAPLRQNESLTGPGRKASCSAMQSSASCSAMHPGPGRKLRFLLGHTTQGGAPLRIPLCSVKSGFFNAVCGTSGAWSDSKLCTQKLRFLLGHWARSAASSLASRASTTPCRESLRDHSSVDGREAPPRLPPIF